MSAFIVNDETIGSILNYLNRQAHTGCYGSVYAHCFRDPALGFTVAFDQWDQLQELGQKLYLMNCDAVDARYGHGTSAQDTATEITLPIFRLQIHKPLPAAQIYKAVQCLLYQCAEGDVDQRPLYKALQRLKAAIADDIITKLPAYQSAPWG